MLRYERLYNFGTKAELTHEYDAENDEAAVDAAKSHALELTAGETMTVVRTISGRELRTWKGESDGLVRVLRGDGPELLKQRFPLR